jgi:phosphoribosyl 1,2-cyclic phosphate phosphodiesterase
VRVTILGSGTSHGVPMIGCECAVCTSTDPRDRRTRVSALVVCDNGAHLLIDLSPDLREQALRMRMRRVDAVLMTHSHADHILGFDELRRFNVLMRATMPVHGDAATLAHLRQAFAYAFDPTTPPGGGIPKVSLHEIDGRFDTHGIAVTPVPIMHGAREILGFRIGAFAYLTDCSAIPERSVGLLAGLDVLVIGALRHRPHPTHFTVAEAVDASERLGASRTFLTHICHDLGHAATEATLPPRVRLAYDSLVVEVG